ncbi:MAG: CRISPR-associated endonuclease Cas2 [Acetatifactor sp.]|nr:CRISPR-associated endonuclease Cas2 [Acetatifactor sp.]
MSRLHLRYHLLKAGYHRIAPEVFMRITTNRKTAQKHFDRLKEYAPAKGEVRILRLTEKQYTNITYLTGCPDEQEKAVGTNCHIML